MGSSSSHQPEPQQPPVDQTQISAEETADAEETKKNLEKVLQKPFTEMEGELVENLYGYECLWKDAGDFQFRIIQMDVINHAIQVLTSELWKPVGQINFQMLKTDAMTYRNAYGDIVADHPWGVLSSDRLFTSITEKENDFRKFENYPANLDTIGIERKLDDFKAFLLLFRKLRDFLLQTMSKSCLSLDE